MNGNFCSVVMMIGVPFASACIELPCVLVDFLHHALFVVELIDGVLKLLIGDSPIRHHDHRIKTFLSAASCRLES